MRRRRTSRGPARYARRACASLLQMPEETGVGGESVEPGGGDVVQHRPRIVRPLPQIGIDRAHKASASWLQVQRRSSARSRNASGAVGWSGCSVTGARLSGRGVSGLFVRPHAICGAVALDDIRVTNPSDRGAVAGAAAWGVYFRISPGSGPRGMLVLRGHRRGKASLPARMSRRPEGRRVTPPPQRVRQWSPNPAARLIRATDRGWHRSRRSMTSRLHDHANGWCRGHADPPTGHPAEPRVRSDMTFSIILKSHSEKANSTIWQKHRSVRLSFRSLS